MSGYSNAIYLHKINFPPSVVIYIKQRNLSQNLFELRFQKVQILYFTNILIFKLKISIAKKCFRIILSKIVSMLCIKVIFGCLFNLKYESMKSENTIYILKIFNFINLY